MFHAMHGRGVDNQHLRRPFRYPGCSFMASSIALLNSLIVATPPNWKDSLCLNMSLIKAELLPSTPQHFHPSFPAGKFPTEICQITLFFLHILLPHSLLSETGICVLMT